MTTYNGTSPVKMKLGVFSNLSGCVMCYAARTKVSDFEVWPARLSHHVSRFPLQGGSLQLAPCARLHVLLSRTFLTLYLSALATLVWTILPVIALFSLSGGPTSGCFTGPRKGRCCVRLTQVKS